MSNYLYMLIRKASNRVLDRRISRGIIVLVMLLSLVVAPVYADTLSIIVLEKGTGDPVANANIVLIDSEDYLTTDEKGLAQLEVEGRIPAIKILASGYETFVAPLKPVNGRVTIYLVPVSLEGTGFDVVADRLPEKISKFSLTAEELAHAPGSQGDPLIAIQSLPGVVVAQDGAGLVYMRGSDVNDNITLVNRVPIGYLYHFGGFRSTINPYLISDLNIFLGGFPVSYGDALGGAIDVSLREPRADKRRYHFDISTIETSVVVEGPAAQSGKDGYYFAARRSYLDLLFSPSQFTDFASDSDKTEEETNQFITVPNYFDIQGLYRQQLTRGYLEYYYFSAGDNLKFENREGVQADPQLAGDVVFDQSFHTLGMTWKAQLDTQWKIDMPLVFFYSQQDFQIGTDDLGNPFFANSEQQNLMWLPQLAFQHDPDNQYMVGVDVMLFKIPLDLYISRPPSEDDVDFDLTDKKKYRLSDTIHAYQLSPYLQYRRQWGYKWTSIAGLRYSYIKGSGGLEVRTLSPRLALEYQYSADTLYSASWGRYVQMPFGFQVLDGFGNPNLDFTEAEHRILGIEHKLDTLWSVKAEAYHKPMEQLVVSIDDQDPPDNYDNLGEGEAYGLDIYLKRERRNGTMGWISYSYSRSERYNPLKPQEGWRDFSGDQPHNMTLVWSQPFKAGPFDWMQNWKRWTWGIKLQVHSGSLYTPVEDVQTSLNPDGSTRYKPVYGEHNSKRTPAYARLDLRIERDILRNTSKIKLYIDILNVTNHKNITGYEYGERFEKIDNPDEVTGLPFFPYIGFEWDF